MGPWYIVRTFVNRPGSDDCWRQWYAPREGRDVHVTAVQNGRYNDAAGTDPANAVRYYGLRVLRDGVRAPECDIDWHSWDGKGTNLEEAIAPGGPAPVTTGDVLHETVDQTVRGASASTSDVFDALKKAALPAAFLLGLAWLATAAVRRSR